MTVAVLSQICFGRLLRGQKSERMEERLIGRRPTSLDYRKVRASMGTWRFPHSPGTETQRYFRVHACDNHSFGASRHETWVEACDAQKFKPVRRTVNPTSIIGHIVVETCQSVVRLSREFENRRGEELIITFPWEVSQRANVLFIYAWRMSVDLSESIFRTASSKRFRLFCWDLLKGFGIDGTIIFYSKSS